MPRYIDADELCKDRVCNDHVRIAAMCEPTADVQEVKHGKWINVRGVYFNTYRECNLCHHVTDDYVINEDRCCFDAPYYCPNCGAKMDGNVNCSKYHDAVPFAIRIHRKDKTLGWTFRYQGKTYGDYVNIPLKEDDNDEAVLLLIKQALQTLENLIRRGSNAKSTDATM